MKTQLIIGTLMLMLALSACGAAPSQVTPTAGGSVTTATGTIVSPPKTAEPTASPAADVYKPTLSNVTPVVDMSTIKSTPEPAKLERSDMVIMYERSGGIDSSRDVFQVHADGSVVSLAKGKATTRSAGTSAVVSAMMTRIVDAGFFSLEDSYMPANKCCDRMTYKLTVIFDGKAKTVTTMDGVEQQPLALANALQEVNALMK